MWNAELDEVQAGIKIAGRNTNNLNMQMTPPCGRKPRGTKSLLMKVKKENDKAGLKFNIQHSEN